MMLVPMSAEAYGAYGLSFVFDICDDDIRAGNWSLAEADQTVL